MAEIVFHKPHSAIRTLICGVFLQKLSKHVALVACLLILGKESGHLDIGQIAIFSLIIVSTVAHAIGRSIQFRLSTKSSLRS